jgi:Zn-dependent protease
VDRARLVNAQMEEQRDQTPRSRSRLAEVGILIGTFSISFVVFSLGFGSWKFGLGFVLLILVHELGHVFEARRQGLHVTLPTFIPLVGAYVLVRNDGLAPWRNALVSLAGPIAGGIGAAVAWVLGSAGNSNLLLDLASIGFLLNAGNLLPIGFLDGGTVFRSISATWRRPRIRYENGVPVEAYAPERTRAVQIAVSYVLVGVALIACYLASRNSGAL